MEKLNSTEYIKAGDYKVIAEQRQKLSWYVFNLYLVKNSITL
jgi:hypothetical protein